MQRKSITEKNISPGIVCTAPWRLTKVTPLANYRLEVEFMDGTSGTVDLLHLIMSDKAGVFEKLKDIQLFNQVYLQQGAVTWPGEIDLAPDAMHDEIKRHGQWVLK
ncbi:MAG: DUF2442 domain-containing protein [Proteobacteria bacterium]|nr:DUF2442 domain-containing protein [Pseudomonadota bacterium]